MVEGDLITQPDPDAERHRIGDLLGDQLRHQSAQAAGDIEAMMASYIAKYPQDAARIRRVFGQALAYTSAMPGVLQASYLQDTAEPSAEDETMIIEGKVIKKEKDDARDTGST